jgi:hypothetical protein
VLHKLNQINEITPECLIRGLSTGLLGLRLSRQARLLRRRVPFLNLFRRLLRICVSRRNLTGCSSCLFCVLHRMSGRRLRRNIRFLRRHRSLRRSLHLQCRKHR